MELTVKTSELAKVMKVAGRIVGTKCILPILEDFLFNAENNTLTVTASSSNMEVMLKTKLMATNIAENGAACVPAKKITDLVSLLNAEELSMKTDESNMKLSWKKGSKSQGIEKAEDYPQFLVPEEEDSIILNSQTLKDAIEKVVPFCAFNTGRIAFENVLFDVEETKTRLVASDTHILRYSTVESKGNKKFSFMLSPIALTTIKNCIGKNTKKVKVTVDSKTVMFCFDDVVVSARNVSAKFPKYREIIDLKDTFDINVNREEITNITKRLKITGDDIVLNSSPLMLTMKSECLTGGESATEECDCTSNGQDLKMKFKNEKLLTALESMTSETCVLKIKDDRKPLLIIGEDDKDANDIALVMPIVMKA